MADLLERIDAAVRLEVSSNSTVLSGPYSFYPSAQEYHSVVSIIVRALFFEAIFDILGSAFGYKSEIDLQKLVAIAGRSALSLHPMQALSEQSRVLGLLGAHISADGRFTLSIEGHDFFGKIDVDVIEFGSAFSRTKFIASIPHILDISKNVIAGMLVVALTSGPSTGTIKVSSGPDTLFVCSINASISGDMEKIIEDAISDLVSNDFQVTEPVSIWKARQLCLYRSGFDPGPIDGIYGNKTKAAEKEFSKAFGGVEVNWANRVFVRFILDQSNKKYQTDNEIQTRRRG